MRVFHSMTVLAILAWACSSAGKCVMARILLGYGVQPPIINVNPQWVRFISICTPFFPRQKHKSTFQGTKCLDSHRVYFVIVRLFSLSFSFTPLKVRWTLCVDTNFNVKTQTGALIVKKIVKIMLLAFQIQRRNHRS